MMLALTWPATNSTETLSNTSLNLKSGFSSIREIRSWLFFCSFSWIIWAKRDRKSSTCAITCFRGKYLSKKGKNIYGGAVNDSIISRYPVTKGELGWRTALNRYPKTASPKMSRAIPWASSFHLKVPPLPRTVNSSWLVRTNDSIGGGPCKAVFTTFECFRHVSPIVNATFDVPTKRHNKRSLGGSCLTQRRSRKAASPTYEARWARW